MSSHNDSFVASGSSPTLGPDFRCENHGSLFLLFPLTQSAQSWVEEHLPTDAQWFGNAVVIEHRYVWEILEAIQNAGLAVQDRNSPYGIYNLWNAASVILGFQLTAFAWRMSRERKMAQNEDFTWFPFADNLNLCSMLVNIAGVFLVPIFGITWIHPAGALAVSLILFAAYPFALAGHYELFFKH